MKIQLLSFRKWKDIIFDLGDSITKISGESGVGKSTIFEAIVWCLYGNIRNVGTKGSKKKTEVIIETKDMRILRSGKQKVSVLKGDIEHHGIEAQGLIDAFFGTYEQFMMTSYLRAESLHPLISASSTEKRELTSLVFPDAAKYDFYRTKIIEKKSIEEKKYNDIRLQLSNILYSIETIETSSPWVSTFQPQDVDDRKKLIEELNLLQAEKKKLVQIETQMSLLRTEYEKCCASIEDTIPLESSCKEIEEKITSSLVSRLSKEKEVSDLRSSISSLRERKEKLEVADGDLNTQIQICKTLLSLSPNLEDLKISMDKVVKTLEEKVGLLCAYEKSFEDIKYNESIGTILTCPSCNSKLRHLEQLEVVTEDITLREIEHYITIDDIHSLRYSIDRLNIEKQQYVSRYNKYSNILLKEKYLANKDISSYLHSVQEYLSIEQKIQEEEKKLEKYNNTQDVITPSEKIDLQNKLTDLRKRIAGSKITLIKRDETLNSLSVLEKEYPFGIRERYEEIEEKVQILQEKIEQCRIQEERIPIWESYVRGKKQKVYTEILEKNLSSRLTLFATLENILASTYQEYVYVKLKEIEYDISCLSKCFFDETMNVFLLPGKTTTTGSIKPSFDIRVEYGDCVFDDIRQMSTGERKRLSIVFLMILSKYLDGKFLLLDEAFTSVGIDTRGVMMNELSRLSIPVYLTSHDEIEGFSSELRLSMT